jgi:hypothetical protein
MDGFLPLWYQPRCASFHGWDFCVMYRPETEGWT